MRCGRSARKTRPRWSTCGGEGPPQADPPSFDRVELRRRIAEAEQTHLHSDLTTCVGAATRALGDPAAVGAARRRLIVATDLTASAWRLDAPAPVVTTPAGPERPEVTLLDAARGERLPNRWVAALAAEPEPAVGSHGYRITATVSGQEAEAARDVPLALRVGAGKDERTAVRSLLDLPASGSVKKSLAHDFASGGPAVVTAALPADALPEDDALSLALDVPREVKVLVVNGAPSAVRHRDVAFFLEAALSGPSSPVRPTVVDAEGFGKARLSDFDVIMLLDLRSPGAKGAELAAFVEGGGGLFVAMGDDVDPDRYEAEMKGLLPAPLHVVKTAAARGTPGAAEKAARLAEIDWDHPVLRIFTGPAREGLESVRTYRYMLLKPDRKEGGARVIARYDDGAPALVEARRGRGRVVLYASTLDPEWSDWTIRTSFLPAMQRIASWLAGALDGRRDAPGVVGAPRPLAVPEGLRIAALLGPDGRERRDLPVEGGGRRRHPGPAGPVAGEGPGPGHGRREDRPRAGLRGLARPPRVGHPAARASRAHRLVRRGVPRSRRRRRPAPENRQLPLWSWLLLLAVAAFLAEGLLLA